MNFRDMLSAELPDPRDDEPENLRSDIMDELADHLACAYRRELLRGSDSAAAARRVLERFGDPAAVARRLWLDAMRGKIMSQRILVVCCIVLTVISLGLAAMMGVLSARAQRQVAEEMRRALAAQDEMLKHLQALSKSPEWIPVRFSLTEEKRVGSPASNVIVRLGRGNGGSSKPDAMVRTSDSQGQADFGVIQPGDFEYRLESGGWLLKGTLNAVPGESIVEQILCPGLPVEKVPIDPRIQWPPDLEDKGLFAEVRFAHLGLMLQEQRRWTSGRSYLNLLRGPKGEPKAGFPVAVTGPWQLVAPDRQVFSAQAPVYVSAWPTQGQSQGPWEPGDYQLQRIRILRRTPTPNDAATGTRFEVIAFWSSFGPSEQVGLYLKPPHDPKDWAAFIPMGESPSLNGIVLSAESRKLISAAFTAHAGSANEWGIPLPEELVAAVREKLKAEPAKK